MLQQLVLDLCCRPKRSFDNFITGNNEHIISEIHNTLAARGSWCLGIVGPSGSGKTHLLESCCYYVNRQANNTIYLDMANIYKWSADILQGLDNVSLVCLDNIDSICGHEVWEEAVFDLFNSLHANKVPFIFSSAVAINLLNIVVPDLDSRLKYALSMPLEELHDEYKIAVMQAKAQEKGLELSTSLCEYALISSDRSLTSLLKLTDNLSNMVFSSGKKPVKSMIKDASVTLY